jgi:hypothetical protein
MAKTLKKNRLRHSMDSIAKMFTMNTLRFDAEVVSLQNQ